MSPSRSRCSFAALFIACLSACPPPPPQLGGYELTPSAHGFEVKVNGKVLLRPVAPAGEVFSANAGLGRSGVEWLYGSFRFNEQPTAWGAPTEFIWKSTSKDSASGAFVDASRNEVVRVEVSSPAEGELSLKYQAVDPAANRLTMAFDCTADDRFAGFGAQADGIDHRGHSIDIWTSEPGIGKRMADDKYPDAWFIEGRRHASSYALPTWVSNRGYQGVVEADARSRFDLCATRGDAMRIEVWQPEATLWIFTGAPGVHPLTQATGRVLGRPRRPPPVAFAPWNDAIFGADNVRRVAALIRDRDIPSSVLWTEDFRGGRDAPSGYRLVEDWDLDRNLYPNAEGLAQELARLGFGWHAYFNTFIVQGEPVYDAAVAGDHLVKKSNGEPYLFSGVTFKTTGLADLSSQATRDWVKGYLRDALDVGFTGWMTDFGEWLPHDAALASKESALLAHNRYPHVWATLTAEVMAERTDDVQRLFFVRSGWFRTNEQAPVTWAGDQRTSFLKDDGLVTVIPMGLGLGLAGVSTYGHDIAGYQSNSATNPPSTKELFFRWTTLGALSPVMRTHHGIEAKKNWHFDSDDETIEHFRRWAKFHIQLFPYLDGASVEAEQKGLPLMRALLLAAPEDEASWSISDQYLLGPSLLVAPIYEEGSTRRTVHVPPGSWVPLSGAGAPVTGPSQLEVEAPLSEIPLFLRAGAVVPRLPERVDTLLPAEPPTVDLSDVSQERWLWVVLGGEGDFTERDGTRYRLTADPASSGYSAGGQPLLDCASPGQRGCVDRSGPRVKVRLSGQTLSLPGHTLTVEGEARQLDVEVLGAP